MKRQREHELDEALEGFYAEADFNREPELPRERNLALPFLLGLVLVGGVMGLVFALWHWREEVAGKLAERGVVVSWMQGAGKVGNPLVPLPTSTPIAPAWEARVRDTGGVGLKMRERPALDSPVVAVLPEGTVVEVLEGPLEAEKHTWWRVAHAGKEGWCAERWLELAPRKATPGPSPTPRRGR